MDRFAWASVANTAAPPNDDVTVAATMPADPELCIMMNAGVTTEQGLLDKENSIHPDFYTNQLSDLLSVREALTPA